MARPHSPLCVSPSLYWAYCQRGSFHSELTNEASADYFWVSKYSPGLCTAHVRDITLWFILLKELYNVICNLNMPRKWHMVLIWLAILGEIFIGNSGCFYVSPILKQRELLAGGRFLSEEIPPARAFIYYPKSSVRSACLDLKYVIWNQSGYLLG